MDFELSLCLLQPLGADIIGVNCRFDPDTVVETTIKMKKAVQSAGLKCHFMCQPIAYRKYVLLAREK